MLNSGIIAYTSMVTMDQDSHMRKALKATVAIAAADYMASLASMRRRILSRQESVATDSDLSNLSLTVTPRALPLVLQSKPLLFSETTFGSDDHISRMTGRGVNLPGFAESLGRSGCWASKRGDPGRVACR